MIQRGTMQIPQPERETIGLVSALWAYFSAIVIILIFLNIKRVLDRRRQRWYRPRQNKWRVHPTKGYRGQ